MEYNTKMIILAIVVVIIIILFGWYDFTHCVYTPSNMTGEIGQTICESLW